MAWQVGRASDQNPKALRNRAVHPRLFFFLREEPNPPPSHDVQMISQVVRKNYLGSRLNPKTEEGGKVHQQGASITVAADTCTGARPNTGSAEA